MTFTRLRDAASRVAVRSDVPFSATPPLGIMTV